MTQTQAIAFAIETITSAKTSMIVNGFSEPSLIYAICNKLSSELNLPLDIVASIFEAA
jgi:hypothetical protein